MFSWLLDPSIHFEVKEATHISILTCQTKSPTMITRKVTDLARWKLAKLEFLGKRVWAKKKKNENEVSQKTSDGIDYRTVGKKRIIFIIFKGKVQIKYPSWEIHAHKTLLSSNILAWNLESPIYAVLARSTWKLIVNCRMGFTQYR